MEQKLDGQTTFVRDIELILNDKDETEVDLYIHQLSLGDEGCVVWDAALVLLKFLFTEMGQGIVKDRHVLELGAGTGVVGLASLFAGSKSVYITDLPRLIPLMNLNVKANYESIKKHRSDLKTRLEDCKKFDLVSVKELTWGSESDVNMFLNTVSSNCEGKAGTKVSCCVLIADCVYYKQGAEDLVKTIYYLLQELAEDSSVLCSYERRTIGDKTEVMRHFLELLTANKIGFKYIDHNDMDAIYRSGDIFILELKREP